MVFGIENFDVVNNNPKGRPLFLVSCFRAWVTYDISIFLEFLKGGVPDRYFLASLFLAKFDQNLGKTPKHRKMVPIYYIVRIGRSQEFGIYGIFTRRRINYF